MNTASTGADPLAHSDSLAQLRDIHLPAPIGWWPPAPGWWLLAAVVLALTAAAVFFLLRRHRQRRYRRLALRAADDIYAQWRQHGDDLAFLQALNRLLKQTALVAFPGAQSAALSGDAWLHFLDSRLPKPQFDQAATRVLADIYRGRVDHLQADAIRRAAQYWLRRHRC